MNDMTGIRVRLFAYLFVLFIFSFVALFGITYSLVDREHLTLEEEFVIKNTKQLQKGYQSFLSSFESRGYDWSRWDDAYVFMKTKDNKFIQSNLSVDTVCGMNLNYLLFVDLEGKIVAQEGCDLQKKEGLFLPSNIMYHLSKGRLLIGEKEHEHNHTGLIETSLGTLIVTAQPILKTDGTGPATGTLILARYLTKDILLPYVSPDSQLMLEQISTKQKDEIQITRLNETTIATSFDLLDIYNNPIERIITTSPRVIYSKRIVTLQYFFLGIFSIGFLILLGEFFVVDKLITRKISALIQSTSLITQGDNKKLDIPFITREKDEFYLLQNSLNAMLDSLQSLSSHINSEQQKAQQYLDLLNSIIRVLDANHTVLLVNKKACQVLEYAREEIVGKDWMELVYKPDEREANINTFKSILSQVHHAEAIESESKIHTKSGKVRLIRWHHALVKDQQGNVLSVVSSGFDMTEEQDAKTQLETRMRDLERLNKLMINRELEMIKLKKQLKQHAT